MIILTLEVRDKVTDQPIPWPVIWADGKQYYGKAGVVRIPLDEEAAVKLARAERLNRIGRRLTKAANTWLTPSRKAAIRNVLLNYMTHGLYGLLRNRKGGAFGAGVRHTLRSVRHIARKGLTMAKRVIRKIARKVKTGVMRGIFKITPIKRLAKKAYRKLKKAVHRAGRSARRHARRARSRAAHVARSVVRRARRAVRSARNVARRIVSRARNVARRIGRTIRKVVQHVRSRARSVRSRVRRAFRRLTRRFRRRRR